MRQRGPLSLRKEVVRKRVAYIGPGHIQDGCFMRSYMRSFKSSVDRYFVAQKLTIPARGSQKMKLLIAGRQADR